MGGVQAAWSGHLEEVVSDTEPMMKGDIFMYGTLPIMFHGADHDYKLDVDGAIEDEKGVLRVTDDEALAAWEALFYGESPKDDGAVSPEEALAAFEAIHFGIQSTMSPRSSLVMLRSYDDSSDTREVKQYSYHLRVLLYSKMK